MPRGRHGRTLAQLRQAIARHAAQLLLENGDLTMNAARHKAQEMLGPARHRDLPDFAEIEAAVTDHLRLFGGAAHAQRLSALRREALRAMRLLAPFAARLVGPLLAGTASHHARVSLHVFADTVEEITHFLDENGIPFMLSERRYRDSRRPYPKVSFVAGDTPVELVIFPPDGRHRAPLSEIDGRPMRRADIADVEALLEASAPAAVTTIQ